MPISAHTYKSNSDYAINRQYTQGLGRFSRVDPSDASYGYDEPQTLNRYAYVQNDPTNTIDPEGLNHVRLDPRYTQFLGSRSTDVAFKRSPKYGLWYNDGGSDFAVAAKEKRVRKGTKKIRNAGGSEEQIEGAIQSLIAWDGTMIPNWVDDAFDAALANFTRCGGDLAGRAQGVSPNGVTVFIEDTVFDVYVSGQNRGTAAGIYIPDVREIHVVNFYYSSAEGYARLASDLLRFEMENYFAIEVGIRAEPRTPNWPCDAPSANATDDQMN
jgi:RHS repeat-associated protein